MRDENTGQNIKREKELTSVKGIANIFLFLS